MICSALHVLLAPNFRCALTMSAKVFSVASSFWKIASGNLTHGGLMGLMGLLWFNMLL